jgi:hypothetical protein
MNTYRLDRLGRPVCGDCNRPRMPAPMLSDEAWAAIAKPDEYLCVHCMGKRFRAARLWPWPGQLTKREKYEQAMAEKRARQ